MLPAELFDIIGDFLHGDRSSLTACGLCRPLLASTRYHLFSELPIQPRTEKIHILADILQSSVSTITPFIQRLAFVQLTRCILVAGILDVENAIRKMCHLLTLLPYARCVRVSNTDFEQVPQQIVRCLASHLHTFTSLELHSLHFYRFSEFVDLISSFHNLQRVELKRLTWTHHGRKVSTLGRVPPGIQWHILELKRAGNLKDLAEWLVAQDTPPLIHTLYYDVASSSEVQQLRALLRRAASSLLDLQVSFPVFADSGRARDALHDFIDLQECTSLRSLRYKYILLFPGHAVTTMISPWVAQMLSQIPSSFLENIAFELMLPTSGDETCLKELDWNGILSALLRKKFRCLRSIQFSLTPGAAFSCICAENFIFDQLSQFRHALRLQICED